MTLMIRSQNGHLTAYNKQDVFVDLVSHTHQKATTNGNQSKYKVNWYYPLLPWTDDKAYEKFAR